MKKYPNLLAFLHEFNTIFSYILELSQFMAHIYERIWQYSNFMASLILSKISSAATTVLHERVNTNLSVKWCWNESKLKPSVVD